MATATSASQGRPDPEASAVGDLAPGGGDAARAFGAPTPGPAVVDVTTTGSPAVATQAGRTKRGVVRGPTHVRTTEATAIPAAESVRKAGSQSTSGGNQ